MNPQRFEIGQAVTPKPEIRQASQEEQCNAFRFGEVYHVEKYHHPFNGCIKDQWYVTVREVDTNAIMEALLDPVEMTSESITELIQETIGESVANNNHKDCMNDAVRYVSYSHHRR